MASWSKDPSSKHGCYLVDTDFRPISFGYNGMPDKTDDSILHSDEKYTRGVKHGEENAIYNAARLGHATRGALAFVTGRPCINCLGSLINSKISIIIFHSLWDSLCKDRWLNEHDDINRMVEQSGIGFKVHNYVDLPLRAHFKGKEHDLEVMPLDGMP